MLPSTSRPREGVTPDWGVYPTRIMIAARLFSPVGNILGQPGGSRTKALPSEKICHGSRLTRRWREPDSNLYGAFPVKWSFGLLAGSLFGAGKSFFVPSPAIRFAERAEGVKGPKR